MKPKGFTLVELLVAIAIFAVLSALGWKVFDYIVKTKDQNAQWAKDLEEAFRSAAFKQVVDTKFVGYAKPAFLQ